MTGIGRDEPNSLRASMAPIRVAEIGSYKCSSALTATWISLSKRSRVKTKRASKAPIYMRTHLMGKRRKEHPEDNIFVNKPFIAYSTHFAWPVKGPRHPPGVRSP